MNKLQPPELSSFDKIIYLFAFTTPLFELPQLFTIWQAGNAENVSLVTWGYLALSSLVWLAYGIHKRIKPLIASYVLYSAVEVAIAVSIVWFK